MKPLFRRHRRLSFLVFGLCLLLAALLANQVWAGMQESQNPKLTRSMERFLADQQPAMDLAPLAEVPCVGGFAGEYPCNNVDLMAFLPLSSIGGGNGADIWGWTDSLDGKEYALMTRSNGTAFVDITDPVNPVYLGNLPSSSGTSSWRDVDTYNDYAFIVSDLNGNHGMQVFDLTRLRNVSNPPVTFTEDAHYSGFGSAHTVTINYDTGYAYAVGTSTCNAGLHIVNIQNPLAPTFAGCYSGDGYTHETQCVIYNGPDTQHQGDEICFASNEDTVTVVDVTNKSAPVQLDRQGYSGSGYTHQGWLTPNHRLFVMDDELDESFFGHNTRTRYFWTTDLENIRLRGSYTAANPAIDHNQYVNGVYIYQSNYRAGLRIIQPPSTEVAYFDIYPSNNSPSFNGAWGNYPFFESGIVIVSGIEQGLFILQPNLPAGSDAWMNQ
ncbi:MAG: choice-of-anchor B family protein [Chloroflexota bacterium]